MIFVYSNLTQSEPIKRFLKLRFNQVLGYVYFCLFLFLHNYTIDTASFNS